jgi:signal transduction histidine kinase/ActR/RegA family two-component response regulator
VIGLGVSTEKPQLDVLLLCVSIGVLFVAAFAVFGRSRGALTGSKNGEPRASGEPDAREHAEVGVTKGEAHANALLDAVPDVLVSLSRDGVVLAVRNDEASPLGNELRPHIGHTLGALFGEDEAKIAPAIANAFATGQVSRIATEVRTESRCRKIEIRIARACDDECLAIVRDITQERETEARSRITDRLVSLGTLASGVAHEINNPLSYVVANVDFVADGLSRLDPALLAAAGGTELRDALEEIREGGRRIASIVESLRYHARQDDDHAAPSDANVAVEAALRILDNQLRYRTRVELALGKVPLCLVHEGRLVQVLVNMLSNALDAFPHRSSDQNLIRIASRCSDDSVVIEIRDNGMGIPKAARERIFDPFFTTKAPGVGTGLGLYLCHQYLASAGGRLDFETSDGGGTTFRVTLPLAESGRAQNLESLAPSLPASRILVVDDDALVARSLARMLRGHELVLSSDGESALWECLSRDFDLILCDLMMPRLDGAGFFAALRDHRPRLASRVVFMTGGAFTSETRAFLESVANPCMEKPIVASRLFETAHRQMTMSFVAEATSLKSQRPLRMPSEHPTSKTPHA